MVLMNNYSDLESVYSLDSLEDETNIIDNTSEKTSKNNCKNVTVPYYTGEVLVESIKSNMKTDLQSGASSTPKSSKFSDAKVQMNLGNKSKKDTVNRAKSCIRTDLSPKQQTTGSNKRISRRKEWIEQNKNSVRARHRSVSYAEQFRKKIYGNNSLDSSTISTAGSTLPDRDKNLSFISCWSGESSMRSMSEFKFYDELINLSPSKEVTAWAKGCLQSSTTLTDNSDKSSKSNKSSKQNKAKPIILSKIEVTIPDQQKPNLDKKRSLEKREMYANSVKVRNEIKINRQREREKKDKFSIHTSTVSSNLSFEDCLLQPQLNNVSFPDGKTKVVQPSIHEENQEKCSKCVRKVPANEDLQKSKRRGMSQSQNKKNKTKPELLKLQERHEREKSMIESMKNLILKT